MKFKLCYEYYFEISFAKQDYKYLYKHRNQRYNLLTLLLYSSTKLPRASRNLLSGLTDQFIEYKGHGA